MTFEAIDRDAMFLENIGSFSDDESFMASAGRFSKYRNLDRQCLAPLPIDSAIPWSKTDAVFLMNTLFGPDRKTSRVGQLFSPIASPDGGVDRTTVALAGNHSSTTSPAVPQLFSPIASPSDDSFFQQISAIGTELTPCSLRYNEIMERSFQGSAPGKQDDMFHLGAYPSPMLWALPPSPSPLNMDETKQRENRRKRKAEHGSSVDIFSPVRERSVMKRRRKGSVTKQKSTMGIPLLESTNAK